MVALSSKSSDRPVAYWQKPGEVKFSALSAEDRRRALADAVRNLRTMPIQSGRRLLIALPNGPLWEIYEKAGWFLGLSVGGIELHMPREIALANIARINPSVIVADSQWLKGFSNELLPGVPVYTIDATEGLIVSKEPADSAGDFLGMEIETFKPRPEAEALYVLSSGTTGAAKVIHYSHRQLRVAMDSLTSAFGRWGDKDRTLCWLPLANLFQRIVNHIAQDVGVAVYYLSDPRQIMKALPLARPTVLIGVPLFYDRFYRGLQARLSKFGRLAQTPLMLWFRGQIARRAFGGHIRLLMTGSAPCPREVLDFFSAVRMPLFEAYGLSENIIPVATNTPMANLPGSVGRVLPPNELRISESGEIEVRGPGVFGADSGSGEFLRTGDLGYLDEEGYLFLLGRNNDMIKTPSGRKIFPNQLEQRFMESGLFQQVLVVGDDRHGLAALVYHEPRAGRKASRFIREWNQTHPGHEQISYMAILDEPLSIDRQELTANLKLRRQWISNHYLMPLKELDQANSLDEDFHPGPKPLRGWVRFRRP